MSAPIRILTVRQPYAWAIIHGGKDVENRVRNLAGDYRGPVAIHAAIGWAEAGAENWEVRRAALTVEQGYRADDSQVWANDLIEEDDPRYIRGEVIGVVDLVDVHESDYCFDAAGHLTTGAIGFCSPWADPNKRHLVLANPRPLSEPIPYRGALGLRTVPAELQARIEAAL